MPPANAADGVQAYRVTLSPKFDVSEETEKKFLKWVQRSADMGYVVAEHGSNGKRHIHALLLFPMKRQKHILQNYFWQNHVKKYHPDSIEKIAVLVNAAYDFKWRDEYLQKEADCEVLFDKWDDDHASKYLPTIEEQNALVEARDQTVKGRAFHDHRMWTEMAGHFKTWYVKNDFPMVPGTNSFNLCRPDHCLEYLNREMLDGRMVVMVDPRRRQEKACWLWRVVTGNAKPTMGELQNLSRAMDGNPDIRI